MSRTGASTPEVMKVAAAASSSVSSLRRASARFRGADDPDPLSVPATAPLPPSLHLANGTVFRMLVSGTRFRLFRMPEQPIQSQAAPRIADSLHPSRSTSHPAPDLQPHPSPAH